MATVSVPRALGPGEPARRVLGVIGVAAGSAILGVALAGIGALAGPLFMVVIPLVVLGALVILQRPWTAVLAVYLSFPIGFMAVPVALPVVGISVDIKLVEVVMLLATVLVVLRRLGTGVSPLRWAPQMWWALLFVGWALAATPSSVNLVNGIKEAAFVIAGFVFAVAVLAACGSMRDVRKVLGGLVVVGAGMCAYGLQGISDLQANFGGAVVFGRASGVFPHPNDLGAFAAIVFMVAVGYSLGARSMLARSFGAGTALLSLLALALSLSRGAWIGTLFGALLMLYLLPRVRRFVLAAGFPLLILAVALGGFRSQNPQVQVVQERLGTFARPFDNPYDDRPTIWREAVREITADPWTGQGPGNFPDASARSTSVAATVGAIHAHNVLLTVAAETGIPNMLLLIGFTISIGLTLLRVVRRMEDPRDRALVAGIGCALFVQVGQGLVDFNFRNPDIFMLMWSLVGLLLVADRDLRTPPVEAARALRG